MATPQISAKLAAGGRLVIPSEYRKRLGLHTGDEVIVILEEDAVKIMTPREAVSRSQNLVRNYNRSGRELSMELIEERRGESIRE